MSEHELECEILRLRLQAAEAEATLWRLRVERGEDSTKPAGYQPDARQTLADKSVKEAESYDYGSWSDIIPPSMAADVSRKRAQDKASAEAHDRLLDRYSDSKAWNLGRCSVCNDTNCQICGGKH